MYPYEKVIHSTEKEKWLEERKKSVGASDTMAPSGLRKKSFGSGFTGNVHTYAGEALETAILEQWAELQGHSSVEECGWLLRRPESPFMHATPDGWKEGEFLVEIKNVGLNKASDWLGCSKVPTEGKSVVQIVTDFQNMVIKAEKKAEPPLQYWRQVQQQLYVTGLPYGYLVGWVGGKIQVEYTILRDEKYIDKRVQECKTFMQKVQIMREMKELGGKNESD